MCTETEPQIDFIRRLPMELIDELVKYLDGCDILTCSRVCKEWMKILDQESTWRRLCLERGWFLNKGGDMTCWRNLYWVNQNWCKGLYKFCKFSDDDISQLPSFNTTFTDFTTLDSDGEFLILPRRDGINIWDITSDAKIHQRISNSLCRNCTQFDIKVNNKFIIYLTGNYIQVYEKESNTKLYNKVKVLKLNEDSFEDVVYNDKITATFAGEMDHRIEVNENYLVVVQNDKTLFTWLLKPWEFIVSIDVFKQEFKTIDIKIVLSHVFLLQGRGNDFRIRAFDMNNKLWTLNLHPNDSEITLDNVHPRLIVGKLLIASVCPFGVDRTVLKVWNFNGQILRTTILPKETYVQCCVVNDVVIYRSLKNAITIWSSINDQVIKELDINGSFNFIEVCPGDLLLVARRAAFEIWDWKKGTQLYTIAEQTHLCYTRLLNSYFYAILVIDMDNETSHVVPQIIVFYFGTNILRI